MRIVTIFRISILKTVYFNFKMLPFRQALKMPIIFTNKTRFINTSGKIRIDAPIKKGMIAIGSYHSEMISPLYNTIDLKGEIIFKGPVQIGCGCLIRVEKLGKIQFGNKTVIGANTKIFCEKKIVIGDFTRIGWEAQIFDTNFHYIKNLVDNTITSKVSEINIGSNNWIGNRSTIMKGTITPIYTIISSNSFCNKNYVKIIPANSIIGGLPAKLIATEHVRVFDKQEENNIDNNLNSIK